MDIPLIYEHLLSLPSEWRIDRISVDDVGHSVDVYLIYTKSTGRDPSSGEERPLYDLRPERSWRHLDTLQYKTYLHARLPRVVSSSGTPITIDIPWSEASSRHTWFFEHLAIEVLLATKNQSRAAQLLRLSFYQMHRIMERAVMRGMLDRADALETGRLKVTAIGIDEKCYQYRTFLTVVSDSTRGAILDVSQGRTIVDATRAIRAALPGRQIRAGVTSVTLDMAPAYRTAVEQQLPKAWITYDKFHLFQHLTEAIDQTRRREVQEQHLLKNTRFLWLKNKEHQTETERLRFDACNDLHLKTAVAWKIRENFREMYRSESPRKALDYFHLWRKDVLESMNRPMAKVADMFYRHLDGIINYFYSPGSNARAERLNGKIQELKVSGKGYRTFQGLRIAILFFYAKLDLFPLKTS